MKSITEILNRLMDLDEDFCVEINKAIEDEEITREKVKEWIAQCDVAHTELINMLHDLYDFLCIFDISYAR